MTEHHNDHDQNGQENHDDCEDCKRQRAENDKLIEIYEKLQKVDQRTVNMKSSIVCHKENAQKSIEQLKKIDQKVEKIKSNMQEQSKTQIQQLGLSLLADMIEKQKKSQAQNRRLKETLKNIHEKRSRVNQQTAKKSFERKNISHQTPFALPEIQKSQQQTARQWFQKSPIISRSQSRKSKSFRQTELGKSFEIFSTKSSFNMTKRKTFEKKDFQELNLWLFDQRHSILEKELYDSSIKQQNGNQIQKCLLQFQGNKVGKYSQNAKYVEKLRNSSNLGVSKLKRSNAQDSFSIGAIKSVLSQNESRYDRFLSKRVQKVQFLPSISHK